MWVTRAWKSNYIPRYMLDVITRPCLFDTCFWHTRPYFNRKATNICRKRGYLLLHKWPLCPLRWRHNGRDSVSNHQTRDCLLNRLFRRRWKNIKAPRHWPLCGEFTGDRWIPRTNGQLRGKCFHLMTSSCIFHVYALHVWLCYFVLIGRIR